MDEQGAERYPRRFRAPVSVEGEFPCCCLDQPGTTTSQTDALSFEVYDFGLRKMHPDEAL
jgi:hypothetical protein